MKSKKKPPYLSSTTLIEHFILQRVREQECPIHIARIQNELFENSPKGVIPMTIEKLVKEGELVVLGDGEGRIALPERTRK